MTEPQPSRPAYDVVVVGARCAGAATARLLAQAGLDVLLVDRTRLPADTVSTHAMMLGAVVQLRRWGLLEAVAGTGATPITAVDMTVGDVSFTAPVKPVGGVDRLYAPRRITLDALLAAAAAEAGAELVTGLTATDVLHDDRGRVTGVRFATRDGRGRDVRARWVVGADGVRSTIAGAVGAPTWHHAPPTNACEYAYWTGLDSDRYTFAFGTGVGAGAIPSDGGLTCVFAAFPTERVAGVRRDLDGEVARIVAAASPQLGEQVAAGRRVTGFRGVRGLAGHLRQPAGAGWLLVGDAGYHRDPYSAHGMTDAFRDAELAARAIVAVAVDGRPEREAMAEFRRRRDDFARPMFHATARLASYRCSQSELLDILSLMGDEGAREARFLSELPEPTGMGAVPGPANAAVDG